MSVRFLRSIFAIGFAGLVQFYAGSYRKLKNLLGINFGFPFERDFDFLLQIYKRRKKVSKNFISFHYFDKVEVLKIIYQILKKL